MFTNRLNTRQLFKLFLELDPIVRNLIQNTVGLGVTYSTGPANLLYVELSGPRRVFTDVFNERRFSESVHVDRRFLYKKEVCLVLQRSTLLYLMLIH